MPGPRALLALLVACALAPAACGGDEKPASEAQASSTASTAAPAAEEAGCEKVAEPKPKGSVNVARPKLSLDPSKTYVVTVLTNCGSFDITLDPKRAPKTGGSFATLVRKKFYDGLVFHRVDPGFVIQGGDPLGTGEGGPGYSIVEPPPSSLRYVKGVVAMAKTQTEQPGTSGSQFFVVTGEDAELPPDYALVGKVSKGMDVVDRIGVAATGPDERPLDPVVIRQMTLATS